MTSSLGGVASAPLDPELDDDDEPLASPELDDDDGLLASPELDELEPASAGGGLHAPSVAQKPVAHSAFAEHVRHTRIVASQIGDAAGHSPASTHP